MSALFRQKKLVPPKRVCLRLKALRKQRNISLETLAKRTKISKKYLQALEECRFNDLPKAAVYQKNFVCGYVEALGVDPGPFLEQYIVEETTKEDRKTKLPKLSIKSNYLYYLPVIIRYVLVISIAMLLVVYLGWQVKNIIEPPKLLVYSPTDGYITDNYVLLVQGETGREVQVSINGQAIMNSEEGKFEQNIDLSPGVNTIVITAQKKHGKTFSITRYVVLKEEL